MARGDNIYRLPRVSIGEAAALFGMTPRALRFYEAKGLFEAGRDSRNMRYYDAAARQRLEWIGRLRRARVPLAEIRQVLEADDDEGRAALAVERLTSRRERVLVQLRIVEGALAGLTAPAGLRR